MVDSEIDIPETSLARQAMDHIERFIEGDTEHPEPKYIAQAMEHFAHYSPKKEDYERNPYVSQATEKLKRYIDSLKSSIEESEQQRKTKAQEAYSNIVTAEVPVYCEQAAQSTLSSPTQQMSSTADISSLGGNEQEVQVAPHVVPIMGPVEGGQDSLCQPSTTESSQVALESTARSFEAESLDTTQLEVTRALHSPERQEQDHPSTDLYLSGLGILAPSRAKSPQHVCSMRVGTRVEVQRPDGKENQPRQERSTEESSFAAAVHAELKRGGVVSTWM